jgi:predicted O-methyltransferase YrrM
MSRSSVSSKQLEYITNLFAEEDALKHEIRKSCPINKSGIQISAYEGKLISIFLKAIGAKTAIELGTLAGYSTAWIASSLADSSKVISVEKDHDHFLLASANLNSLVDEGKVEIVNQDAVAFCSSFEGEVDVVFIDANKKDYPLYFEFAKRVLRNGGMLIADNVFLWGSVYDSAVKADSELVNAMQKFNHMVAEDDSFTSVILTTDEGLLVAIKNK